MPKNILIFDIDGTLCDINQPINSRLLSTLKNVSQHHQIVLASGKPFGYIAGFIRQLGLKDCIVIGENGGTIMYSATFPPKAYYQIKVSNEVEKIFYTIRKSYTQEFSQSIWFQPNDVNLTVFPIDISDIDKIHQFAKQFESDIINTYYHKDSVDFTPKGFDKGTAVDILCKQLGYSADNLYIFGDGSNDIPMLLKTKNAYSVGRNFNEISIKKVFLNYTELSKYLENHFL